MDEPPRIPSDWERSEPQAKSPDKIDIKKFIRTWGVSMAMLVCFLVAGFTFAGTPNLPLSGPTEILKHSEQNATANVTIAPIAVNVVSKIQKNFETSGYTITTPFERVKNTSLDNVLYEGVAYKNGTTYNISIETSETARRAYEAFNSSIAADKGAGATGGYKDTYTWIGMMDYKGEKLQISVTYLIELNAVLKTVNVVS